MGCLKLTYQKKPVLKVISSKKELTLNKSKLKGRISYPFGALLPGRSFNSSAYDRGFQGQIKDDEIAGYGNSMSAEFWQYDTRIGRRWNLDPKPNASISQYATFANNPLWFSDPFGDTINVDGGWLYRQVILFVTRIQTSDKIGYDNNNNIVIKEKSENPKKENGTGLIRDMIGAKNTAYVQSRRAVFKTLSESYSKGYARELTKEIVKGGPQNISHNSRSNDENKYNGTGHNVGIYMPILKIYSIRTKGGKLRLSGIFITLPHEYHHGKKTITGTHGEMYADPSEDYSGWEGQVLSEDEADTRQFENLIRIERHRRPRYLFEIPLPNY